MGYDDGTFALILSVELGLLRSTLPLSAGDHTFSTSSNSTRFNGGSLTVTTSTAAAAAATAVDLINDGKYVAVLSHSSISADLFKCREDSMKCFDSAELFYEELLQAVESFLVDALDEDDASELACRALLLTAISVSAFFIFCRSNITGPNENFHWFPLSSNTIKAEEGRHIEWEAWANIHLISAGSDLLAKFSNAQYLVFAKMLLMRVKDVIFKKGLSSLHGVRSISLWLVRILFVQQRLLDQRSSSLFNLLQVFISNTLHNFGTVDDIRSYWGDTISSRDASIILSSVHIEAGIIENSYGRIDHFRKHLELAEAAAGLNLSVTGALGVRTVHQIDPKAQLVLVNKSVEDDGVKSLDMFVGTERNIDMENTSLNYPNDSGVSDIYISPRLLSGGMNCDNQCDSIRIRPLRTDEQVVVLAHCLFLGSNSCYDKMQKWDMAPYIEAIDCQASSCFSIRCCCDILRIRWESIRSRTRERALLMMEKLAKIAEEPSPDITQRIHFIHSVFMPTIPELQKEYGELLVSYGLVGEALKIFEDLELWDNLIFCYRLLDKKASAVELIQKRLSLLPTDPRLWCSLGDVTENDSCFEKALEVSNNRSVRAKVSLARSAYNRGDYSRSKELWQSAMAVNSMYTDGWFALGAAAMKDGDVDKALEGFTRVVQSDNDNGEAWNNIACLLMMKKKSKEAYSAFEQAAKFKRTSWQVWDNFSQVAMDTCNFSKALESMQNVLDLRSKKSVDPELLERLIVELEKRSSHTPLKNSTSCCNINQTAPGSCETPPGSETAAGHRETMKLMNLLGKILKQIVQSDGEPKMWGIYARWHKINGDLIMCSEALLKQVRSYQSSELWSDGERFKKFVIASLNLCEVYMEISPTNGRPKELFACEMHLKNAVKHGFNFSETKEFRDLEDCLGRVKSKLQFYPQCRAA